ncbi:ABC transporter permease [Halobacteriaceae archaeon GCM10025711]
MNWLVVARKDFADAVRSRMLWSITAIFTVMIAGTVVLPQFIPETEPTAAMGLGIAAEFAGMLVPITALVAAYLAIAGERESGSIKLLLGLPPSRGEVVVGKLVGRAGVVALAVLASFAVAGVATAGLYGSLPVTEFLLVTGLTLFLGVTFVSVAIGISSATSTRSRAMTFAVGVYLVVSLLWDLIPQGLYLALVGGFPTPPHPEWFLVIQRLSPSSAYSAGVAASLIPEVATGPAYLGLPFTLAVMTAWTLVPLALGYLWFRRADLS